MPQLCPCLVLVFGYTISWGRIQFFTEQDERNKHHQSLESLQSTKTLQFIWAWPENSSQHPLELLLLTAHPLLQTSEGLIVTLPLKLIPFVAMRLSLPWNYRLIQCSCLIPIENQHGFSLSCWDALSKGFLERQDPHSQPFLLLYQTAWWKKYNYSSKGGEGCWLLLLLYSGLNTTPSHNFILSSLTYKRFSFSHFIYRNPHVKGENKGNFYITWLLVIWMYMLSSLIVGI